MGIIRALASGVWCSEVSLREFDVRGALVVGTTRALVWDTLSHPRDVAGYRPLIGDRALTIVYSHADWDHIWGTGGLPHERAAIVGHRSCLARFAEDAPKTLASMRGAEPGAWDDVELVPPTEVFDDELALDLGAVTVSLHHLPGHTRDCCVAFVRERGLLLMGDTAETPFPVVPAGAQLESWIGGLERWERDRRVKSVVPAHGSAGSSSILRDNIRYLSGLRDGHPVEVPAALTSFYRSTHASNLQAAGLAP